MWSVAEAKMHLAEVLRRARGGEPQIIGADEGCVVISMEMYRERIEGGRGHDGRWLIARGAQVGADIPLPTRHDDAPGWTPE